LFKEDDDDWRPALTADGAVVETCVIRYPAIDCNAGSPNGQRSIMALPGVASISVGVECASEPALTCGNGALGHHKVQAVLYGATVTLSDSNTPTVSNLGGSLLGGGYVRGNSAVSFDASDNAGIRIGRLYVDGIVRASSTYGCDFTYAVPCSNKAGAVLSLDTRPLSDGTHTIQVAAVDPAGNETRSGARSVVVDNNAPGPPAGLSVDGGSDWRGENLFSVSWSDPSDSGSAVAAARYELCANNGSGCQPVDEVTGPNVSRIDGISVPETGEWTLRVWLVDGAGNVDVAKSSVVSLRYGTPPSAPPPAQNEPAPAPAPDEPAQTTPLVDVTAALTSPAPTAGAFRRDIGLRLTSARFARGRLLIRGHLRAPARVVFTVRTSKHRFLRKTIAIDKRRFAVSLRLRHPGGRLTARFAGDTAFRPATARLHVTR
jgi:hypothetical protein